MALASIVKQYQLGYVTELDVLAITNALEDILRDPLAAKLLGDRARQLISEKYTWRQIACEMQNMYADILQPKLVPVN